MTDTLLDRDAKLKKVLGKIDVATQINDHNGARMLLARFLVDNFLDTCYAHVNALNIIVGYMPDSLLEFRKELDIQLFRQADINYPDDISRIRGVF